MAETDPSGALRNLTRVATQISYLSVFKPLLRTQCCDLARRIRFLAPLFHELHDDVVFSGAVPFPALQDALFKARDLLQFATRTSQVFMILDREQVKHRFKDVAVRFEHAISKISFDELDVSEEIKEQVALVTTQFRRAKEQFDPPGFQLYEQLLSVYNQSYDVNAETAELSLISEKLQFINVDDVKQESLALEKMAVERRDHSQKSIQDMSLVVLKKIQDFLMVESGNIIVSASEDLSRQTDESYVNVKLCPQSLVIPDEFRCPISLELMKDPVIICTGQFIDSCISNLCLLFPSKISLDSVFATSTFLATAPLVASMHLEATFLMASVFCGLDVLHGDVSMAMFIAIALLPAGTMTPF
ncbi:hypothetical protein ACSQ67_025424 [Phaseolus vulgaris]